jgi:hypothetical protein
LMLGCAPPADSALNSSYFFSKNSFTYFLILSKFSIKTIDAQAWLIAASILSYETCPRVFP